MKRKYNKDVHYVCKLTGIKKIEKVYGKLKNYDVVLTDKRKQHILDRRKNDGLDVILNLKDSIENYDYLLDAGDKAVKYIKINKYRNYAYILNLVYLIVQKQIVLFREWLLMERKLKNIYYQQKS